MKQLIFIGIFFGAILPTNSQISNAIEKFVLPNALSESSGVIFFNGKLITHNDSGGENKLYELDTISGLVTREVTISNATNVDWEDIAQDASNIYVGDIGNNASGNRTNLKIYKINKTDYTNSNSITAEIIAYSYADQTDFTPQSSNNTKWDSEALVSFDATHLIVFTKNWVDGITKGYLVPKTQGTYSANALPSSLNSGGLITGATLNPLTGKLYLVGYSTILQPFIWVSGNFSGNDVFSGTNSKTNLSTFGFEQAEGICYVEENRYFITSESFSQSIFSDYAKAIAFSTNDATLSIDKTNDKKDILIYPNPVVDLLYFKTSNIYSVDIYDTKLVKLYHGKSNTVSMGQFSKGLYIIKVLLNDNVIVTKKVFKN